MSLRFWKRKIASEELKQLDLEHTVNIKIGPYLIPLKPTEIKTFTQGLMRDLDEMFEQHYPGVENVKYMTPKEAQVFILDWRLQNQRPLK